MEEVLPFCDILIGNETEAETWANKNGLPGTKDLATIAKAVALTNKKNTAHPRIVVFTNGAEPTVLVSSAEPDSPKIFPVTPLNDEQIVDTNGAGDAFAGGFIAALIDGKSWDQCVELGQVMGAMCIQEVCNLIIIYFKFCADVCHGDWPSIQVAQSQGSSVKVVVIPISGPFQILHRHSQQWLEQSAFYMSFNASLPSLLQNHRQFLHIGRSSINQSIIYL
jgi:bifunctional ADP-heptose synthase (sugar kinase/adenylyltransferase)